MTQYHNMVKLTFFFYFLLLCTDVVYYDSVANERITNSLDTESDVPGPPKNLFAISWKSATARVRWEKPEDHMGTSTDYLIQMREADSLRWSPVIYTKNLSHTFSELSADKAYTFRVAARNQEGLGHFTELSKPITCEKGM